MHDDTWLMIHDGDVCMVVVYLFSFPVYPRY